MPKPTCRKCGNSDNVVRWLDGWICRVHMPIRNKRKEKRRILGIVLPSGVQDPDPDLKFTDIYPNRAARRAVKGIRRRNRV